MFEVESQIKTSLKTITPELAESWLKKNIKNRPIRQGNLALLMQQLKSNSWVLNNDAICFDKEGNLLNGQHRLTACVNTGISFECLVMRGLEPKSFNVMDTGDKRTSGDVLGANNVEFPAVKSTLIRFVLEYKAGRVMNDLSANRATKATNQIILDFYNKNQKKIDEAVAIGQQVYRNHHMFASGIIGSFAYIFNEIDKQSCAIFMEQFGKGEDLRAGDPVLVLRQQLFKNAQSRTKYSKTTKLAWVILAWNSFRANKKVRTIYLNTGAKFPIAI